MLENAPFRGRKLKSFWGGALPRPLPYWGGAPLTKPYPPQRLRRLDTCAFGARRVPPIRKSWIRPWPLVTFLLLLHLFINCIFP